MADIIADLASLESYHRSYGDKEKADIAMRARQTIEWQREHQRAPKGSGTKANDRPLTERAKELYDLMGQPSKAEVYGTVRGWQTELANRGVKQNYHQTQANLSVLLGRGLIEVADPREVALRYRRRA